VKRRIALVFGVVVAAVAVTAAGWVAANWPALSSFPGMPSAYESKELCSCLWVEGRSEADCMRFVAQDVVPVDAVDVDSAGRRVTVRALWTANSARWLDERSGCRLE
jgi:hypothetical protein